MAAAPDSYTFVEEDDYSTISLTIGGASNQYSIGNCIQFTSSGGDTLKGKITGFGHDGGRLNRIFYKKWIQAEGKYDDSEEQISFNPAIHRTTGRWKTIQKLNVCPDISQMGGRRRKHRRRPSRKVRRSHHRKTRKH